MCRCLFIIRVHTLAYVVFYSSFQNHPLSDNLGTVRGGREGGRDRQTDRQTDRDRGRDRDRER